MGIVVFTPFDAPTGSAVTPATSTLTYKVFASTAFTSPTTLTQWFDDQTVDILNDVGHGQLSLQNDDSQISLCPRGAVIQKLVDTTPAFSWIIDRTVRKSLTQGEEADQFTQVSGSGLGQILNRAVVAPTLGYDRSPWGTSRTFSFATPSFSTASWGNATVIVASQSTASTYWTGMPTGMPGDPPWIGPSSGTDAQAPIGYWYTTYDFTLASDAIVIFFMAADGAAYTYVDGFLLSRLTGGSLQSLGWQRTNSVAVFLTAGTHRFAARVANGLAHDFDNNENLAPGKGAVEAGNPTGFMAVGYTVDTSGKFGTQALITSASWKILEYPDNPPGWTIGGVVNTLLTEAQTDGLLPGLTWDFTATTDTKGNAWDTLETVTVGVGDDLLTVIRQFGDGFCDWAMAPDTLKLHLWRYGERGATQTIAYTAGSNLMSLTHDGMDVGTDALIVTWAGGQFRYPASGGTRIGSFSTKAATKNEAKAQAAQQLALLGGTRIQFAADVEPVGTGDQPYTGYTLGDVVAVPNESDLASAQRVTQIVGQSDPEGNAVWSPSFRDLFLDMQARLALTLKRQASGTMGGWSQIAAPSGQLPNFQTNISASEVTFHLQGNLVTGAAPWKIPAGSGNLYQFALTLGTAGTTTTTVSLYVAGVNVGSGSLLSGQTFKVFTINPPVWVQGNSTTIYPNVTAAGTGAADLLVEPRFL